MTNQQIKERPVNFKPFEVTATLVGRKAQFRRIIKNQPRIDPQTGDWLWVYSDGREEVYPINRWIDSQRRLCKYGQPGDRLWVRETWGQMQAGDGGAFVYRADLPEEDEFPLLKWRPSIHMPRAACRIILEVVSVRVELLQEISEDDAIAEGVEPIPGPESGRPLYPIYGSKSDWVNERYTLSPIVSFKHLCQSMHGPESREQNPWVCVVEFKRVATTESKK